MSISLKSGGPVKVFLDRNISARSMIIEGAIQSQRVQWGPIEEEVAITGWRRKPMRDGDARWIVDEVACLPTVARLATDGTIALFESREINFERLRASTGARGTKGDIFNCAWSEYLEGTYQRLQSAESMHVRFENQLSVTSCRSRSTQGLSGSRLSRGLRSRPILPRVASSWQVRGKARQPAHQVGILGCKASAQETA